MMATRTTKSALSSSSNSPISSRWAHSVNSRARLEEALLNRTTTVEAIECDVVLLDGLGPILAHPPCWDSDLTVQDLLDRVYHTGSYNKPMELKLDFKELAAVQPTLDKLVALLMTHKDNDYNFNWTLNADILPGPGFDRDDGTGTTVVPATEFLETCLAFVSNLNEKISCTRIASTVSVSLSLGYKCKYDHPEGYLPRDVQAMTELLQRYSSFDDVHIVLALNARVLAKTIPIGLFDDFLQTFSASILAWTGTGEPPIPQSIVDDIQKHFQDDTGHLLRDDAIEFDCNILAS